MKTAEIHTPKGVMKVEFYEQDAPNKIKCETSGGHQYHERGALSMAHAGKDTGGSQFFIVHSRDNTAHLDRVHTVFGKVVEGEEIIDQIKPNDEITKIVVKDGE
jgi:peptidyl-prolyl cis-trans isomerase B (cyclophilin B)